MAYSKQNFQNGQILNAANLETMENGIIAAQNPRNLLDNSDFSNPVNQRGSTSYSGSGYSIDRWYSNGNNQTVQVSGSYIRATATGTSYCGIRQKVERMASLAGKTITFAAKVYSNVVPSIRFINASASTLAFKDGEKATTTTIVLTYTVPSDATMGTVIPIIIAKTTAVDDYINIYWAAIYEGAYTADTLPSYVPKDKHVEMLNCGVPLQPRNLLDNSNFRNPVNQRGATTYTGATYTIDRWWLTACTLKVNTNGVTLTSDASTACTLLQFIDHISDGIYTFAAKVAGTVRTRVIQVSGTSVSTLDASNASYSIGYLAFQYNEHRSKFYSSITVNKGENRLFVEWAALYEGAYDASTLPAYQPKDSATELAECQRYFIRVSNSAAYGVISGTGCVVKVPLPTTMRNGVTPTATLDSAVWAYTHEGYVRLTFIGTMYSTNTASLHFTLETETSARCCVVPDLSFNISADL